MSQRQITLGQLTATRASGAVVLIRLYVGLIFVGEGVLKFVRPDTLGPGRFEKAGIPAGALLANLDGVFEIVCGAMILAGLLVRPAPLPMIVDMIGALAITKLPLLWGSAPLYPKESGFWDFFHEGRLEIAMLCGSLFLLVVGAGGYSLDARMERVDAGARVSGVRV
jgi:putative oxidoreductase